jgi:hypothetical protein
VAERRAALPRLVFQQRSAGASPAVAKGASSPSAAIGDVENYFENSFFRLNEMDQTCPYLCV